MLIRALCSFFILLFSFTAVAATQPTNLCERLSSSPSFIKVGLPALPQTLRDRFANLVFKITEHKSFPQLGHSEGKAAVLLGKLLGVRHERYEAIVKEKKASFLASNKPQGLEPASLDSPLAPFVPIVKKLKIEDSHKSFAERFNLKEFAENFSMLGKSPASITFDGSLESYKLVHFGTFLESYIFAAKEIGAADPLLISLLLIKNPMTLDSFLALHDFRNGQEYLAFGLFVLSEILVQKRLTEFGVLLPTAIEALKEVRGEYRYLAIEVLEKLVPLFQDPAFKKQVLNASSWTSPLTDEDFSRYAIQAQLEAVKMRDGELPEDKYVAGKALLLELVQRKMQNLRNVLVRIAKANEGAISGMRECPSLDSVRDALAYLRRVDLLKKYMGELSALVRDGEKGATADEVKEFSELADKLEKGTQINQEKDKIYRYLYFAESLDRRSLILEAKKIAPQTLDSESFIQKGDAAVERGAYYDALEAYRKAAILLSVKP